MSVSGSRLMTMPAAWVEAWRATPSSWRAAPTYNLEDSLNWQKGTHSLNFGGAWLRSSAWENAQQTVPQVTLGFVNSTCPGGNPCDPASGLFVVSAADAYSLYFFKPEYGQYGWAGADYTVHSRGELRALDYATGEVRWRHDLHGGAGNAGVLTTASGLTFTGDAANSAMALGSSDGRTLWHAGVGRVGNSPITYELDGRQYVLIGGGSALYAFALPESP